MSNKSSFKTKEPDTTVKAKRRTTVPHAHLVHRDFSSPAAGAGDGSAGSDVLLTFVPACLSKPVALNCPHPAHLAMPTDICDCHKWGDLFLTSIG